MLIYQSTLFQHLKLHSHPSETLHISSPTGGSPVQSSSHTAACLILTPEWRRKLSMNGLVGLPVLNAIFQSYFLEPTLSETPEISEHRQTMIARSPGSITSR